MNTTLRANGKAFCAGADLEYLQRLQNFSFEENLQDSTHLMDLFLSIYKNTKPVIAQIEGHALAGGCGLATVCDFAFSVPEAKFGYTEVKIGFIPAIVMYFLLRKTGEAIGKDLLISGRLIDAAQAKNFHLVNEIIDSGAIKDYVKKFALELCENNSAQSMAITKKMIGDIQHFSVDDAMRFASRMNAHARSSEDCKRGISSFLKKEEIKW